LLFVPLDRGGAVEFEAVDPMTGQQLAAMGSGYFPQMTELKARFSKLVPAEIALKNAAPDFARLLKSADRIEPEAPPTRRCHVSRRTIQ
jgi:hypothetical protein